MVDFQNDIEKCVDVLQNGGLILYPTDTIWGIGCDANNSAAIEKIYKLKARPDKKSMIILVADEKEISSYVSRVNKKIFDQLKTFTKPTTVIYDHAFNLPSNIISKEGTVAIRIAKDEFCRQLIQRFERPIVSTSANISGQPSPKNFKEVSSKIKNGVDYIVQHRQDDLNLCEPSSIIKFDEEGNIIVIRK